MNSSRPWLRALSLTASLSSLLALPFGSPVRADSTANGCQGLARTFTQTENAAQRLKDCARTHEERGDRITCVGEVSPEFREAVYDIRCQDDCEDAPEADRRACYIINANVFRGRLEGMGVSAATIDRLRSEASDGSTAPQTEDQWRAYLEGLSSTLRTEEAIASLGTSASSDRLRRTVAPASPSPQAAPTPAACAEFREFTALATAPSCRSTHRTVHLTFDDGPKEDLRTDDGMVKTTSLVLDTLKNERIPATFFVLGERLDPANAANSASELTARFRLIRRMQAEGHTIASHSYTHEPHTRLSSAEVADFARKARSAGVGYEVDGVPVAPYLSGVYRLPYGDGATNTSVRTEIYRPFENQGFRRHLYWDIDTNDWRKENRADPDRLLRSLMNQLCHTGGGTVLFHDIHASTARNLPRYIQAMKCAGYSFGDLGTVLGGSIPALESPSAGRAESVTPRQQSSKGSASESTSSPSRSSTNSGSRLQ